MSKTTMEQHANIHDFADEVDQICEEEYGVTDGGDLCYNLIESGVIDMAPGERVAARTVAMHTQQA